MDFRGILVILLLIFVVGCVSDPVCDEPYILVGGVCCLDGDDNKICDRDEIISSTTSTPSTSGTHKNANAASTSTTSTSTTSTSTTIIEQGKPGKETAVMLLMDISESMKYGLGEETQADLEKALVIDILDQLDPADYVGLIVFNSMAYVISPPVRLGDVEAEFESTVQHLRLGGGSDMVAALGKAEEGLSNFSGRRYVVVVSDGVILPRRKEVTCDVIESMSENGIIIHVVGVGFNTDEEVMGALADAGEGRYFKVDEYMALVKEIYQK